MGRQTLNRFTCGPHPSKRTLFRKGFNLRFDKRKSWLFGVRLLLQFSNFCHGLKRVDVQCAKVVEMASCLLQGLAFLQNHVHARAVLLFAHAKADGTGHVGRKEKRRLKPTERAICRNLFYYESLLRKNKKIKHASNASKFFFETKKNAATSLHK